jgi:hypothetical protein
MSSCNTNSSHKNMFKLDLWDYNSSMAYSLHYHFDNEGMFITKLGGLINEMPDTLIRRELSDNERDIIYNALFDLPIDSLKNEYIDPLTEDGDQKRIELSISNKVKDIRISNVYQEDISILINVINEFLDDQLKIDYRQKF